MIKCYTENLSHCYQSAYIIKIKELFEMNWKQKASRITLFTAFIKSLASNELFTKTLRVPCITVS